MGEGPGVGEPVGIGDGLVGLGDGFGLPVVVEVGVGRGLVLPQPASAINRQAAVARIKTRNRMLAPPEVALGWSAKSHELSVRKAVGER